MFSRPRSHTRIPDVTCMEFPTRPPLTRDAHEDPGRSVQPRNGESRPAIPLFRPEAVEAHDRPHDTGDIVRISPRWGRRTAWALGFVVASAILFTGLVPVTEHASGPALLRAPEVTEVTALLGGSVNRVHAAAGDEVEAGSPLVQLDDRVEFRELQSLQTEFDLQLARLLRDPADEGARQALASLRPRRDLARTRVEQRLVRAPHAGTVGDVWTHEGQRLEAGETLLTLTRGTPGLEVVSLLPGRYRPMLEEGMPLRLEVQGFAHAYLDLEVAEVSEEVVGPAAARRALGPAAGDAIPLHGPVVIVRALLASPDVDLAGDARRLHPGMTGRVDVPVRKESLLLTLVPAFREITERVP